MGRVLILGYGNPLRGDDGIGPRAAEALRRLLEEPETTVIGVHQLTPELAADIARCDAVLFVDASRSGRPGEVRSREILGAPGEEGFTHQFTPERLMAVAATLFARRPPAWEITLCGESFDLAEDLTPRAAAAMPALLAEVARMRAAISETPAT